MRLPRRLRSCEAGYSTSRGLEKNMCPRRVDKIKIERTAVSSASVRELQFLMQLKPRETYLQKQVYLFENSIKTSCFYLISIKQINSIILRCQSIELRREGQRVAKTEKLISRFYKEIKLYNVKI